MGIGAFAVLVVKSPSFSGTEYSVLQSSFESYKLVACIFEEERNIQPPLFHSLTNSWALILSHVPILNRFASVLQDLPRFLLFPAVYA